MSVFNDIQAIDSNDGNSDQTPCSKCKRVGRAEIAGAIVFGAVTCSGEAFGGHGAVPCSDSGLRVNEL